MEYYVNLPPVFRILIGAFWRVLFEKVKKSEIGKSLLCEF